MKQKIDSKPLVSVIMPVYNAGEFLVEAIESILKQTYQNFEFIIVNDASKDNSLKIMRKYKKRFPDKIKVINLKNNLNKGGDACANLGIEKARGKYIARMDADDIAHSKRLEKQVEFLENNPNVFLAGTNAFVINGKGKIIGKKLEPLNNEEIYKAYFGFHPIIHPSSMFRRYLKNKKRFSYPIRFSANNDYYAFFKLICQGYRFANLKEKLLYYRIHGKNMTFVNIKENFMNTIKIRFQMFKRYGYNPTKNQVLTTILQALVIFALPKEIIKNLYLFSKGIIKPRFNFFDRLVSIVRSVIIKKRYEKKDNRSNNLSLKLNTFLNKQ